MRILMVSMLFVFGVCGTTAAAPREPSFDDPMFRRCVTWMLDGKRGALLQGLCLDEYEIPPPSLFLCARKVQTGFRSPTDREGCAIVFEEQAKKVRGGFIRCMAIAPADGPARVIRASEGDERCAGAGK